MDISKQYIEMCDCPEIQNGRQHEPLDFWQYSPDSKYVDHWSQVWLPRQDQLQEMSGMPWVYFDHECCEWLGEFPTKEQVGIQVVMEEKYDKVWDGKWVDRV